jgi:hypothetical protein
MREGTTSNPTAALQKSILSYAAGQMLDETGFVVGSDVSPFEISGAVNRENPALFVVKVEIATKGGTPVYSTDTLIININQLAAIEYQSDITVVIEQ